MGGDDEAPSLFRRGITVFAHGGLLLPKNCWAFRALLLLTAKLVVLAIRVGLIETGLAKMRRSGLPNFLEPPFRWRLWKCSPFTSWNKTMSLSFAAEVNSVMAALITTDGFRSAGTAQNPRADPSVPLAGLFLCNQTGIVGHITGKDHLFILALMTLTFKVSCSFHLYVLARTYIRKASESRVTSLERCCSRLHWRSFPITSPYR